MGVAIQCFSHGSSGKSQSISLPIEEPAAKATYVRKTDRWKIYWHRADMKWHAYPPHSEAVFFDEFVVIVDEDEHCCFWG